MNVLWAYNTHFGNNRPVSTALQKHMLLSELHHGLKMKIWCLVVSIRSLNACNSKVVIFN